MRDAIAVIPARGGSSRLPDKNVLDFMGKPMIAWTIEAARDAGRFSRVLVSTDDPRIAEVAARFGAEPPFLRDAACDERAPVSEATLAALRQCEAELGETYRTVVQLFPVCPLRTAQDIREAMDAFTAAGAPFQLSCYRYQWMNPWWACTLDGGGSPERVFPERFVRGQDLPPLYGPTGAIWIADVAALREHGTFYGPGHRFHPLDTMRAVDIDTRYDLEMARAYFLLRGRT